MTILNSFAQTADGVAENIGMYFVNRDPTALTEAIEKLQGQIAEFQQEQSDPALQETTVTLTRMNGDALLAAISKDNALCLRNEEYRADGPLVEGKLLRVKPFSGFDLHSAADAFAEENSGVYLTKVTMCTSECLILAPVVTA